MEDLFKEFVKAVRLAMQAELNELINEAEDELVKEAVEAAGEQLKAIPAPVIEMFAKKLYWKAWEYVKDKYDVEWIEDI